MFLLRSRPAAVALAALALAPATTHSAETLPGPYLAQVERVVDGDTLAVRVAVWLGQELAVLVRIRGIDAPERRARCPRERDLAQRAAAHLGEVIGEGPVALTNIAGGKFYGRVVADVASADRRDIAAAMLGPGLARPYDGGSRQSWCDGGEPAATAAR